MHLLKKMSLLFIALSLLAIFSIPECSCQDQQYMDCVGANHCAGMRFAYPFWVGDVQNTSCGYPGFQVSCQANIPRLTIGELTYRVLSSVYASNRTLTVAREDLLDNVCPTILKNTTLDVSSMFSFTNSTKNLTLSYGCTSSDVPSMETPENKFDCLVNGTTSSSFFTTSDATIPPAFKCNSSIFVAVHQSAAQNLKGVGALRAALAAGFTLQYRVNSTFCERCIDTGGRCGFNTSSTMMACYCADGAHDWVCDGSSGSTTKLSRVAVVLIVISVVLVSLVSIIVIYYLAKRRSWWESIIYWKSEKGSNQLVQEYMRNYGSMAPKLYTYSEIKKMTNSFSNKLGHGGYGFVFKGKLPDGRLVAVKVLNDDSGSGEDFINEVGTISRTSHVNVVALLGFCYNRSKRALIYEFMPNGSLDKFLTKKKGSLRDVTKTKDLLNWKLLYEIAVGIARGLEYLHRGCSIRVVHFDIKPQNILLDAEFCPKISDFGLAKLCQKKESIMSSLLSPRGTIGYMAPEVFCRNFGGVSHKSDVYSYGMMVLEMVGLRSKLEIDSQQTSESYFPNWIYKHCELSKCLSHKSAISEEEETVTKMGIVGLWCIQTNPGDRPSIGKVLEMLESSSESLQIPPKPFVDDPIDTGMDSDQESWMSNITNDENLVV